ncbi:cupin domain-containing protein [Halobacterium sp. R2-5]|uniref:cupin domain-containing protein n=1 Tax=Halobacterium sp. R2-5 TaxID=2715751 RepID=UPI00141E773D|nr:cupin domain-containing protein [Halobacterium sp. R2-5]NIB98164.1 cupin domain-containing protein [Halobacterium sp. R2-5]
MRTVALDDFDSRMGPADRNVPLTDALGAANAALNYYELDEGDSFAYGVHAHQSQEEFFYVVEGTVTFETLDVQQSADADGDAASTDETEVSAGELARFGPGEFQRGVNRGSDRVRALAIGAPQDAGDTEILRECGECGETTTQAIELADDRSEIRTICESCGSVTGRFD